MSDDKLTAAFGTIADAISEEELGTIEVSRKDPETQTRINWNGGRVVRCSREFAFMIPALIECYPITAVLCCPDGDFYVIRRDL